MLTLYASGDKIICPVCGAENPKGAKFCWRCGAPLTQKLKKKKATKKKISTKIASSDSLLQTLKEIKDLLKEIKEELRQKNIYARPVIQNIPRDTLIKIKIPREQRFPAIEKKAKKKENDNNTAIAGGLAGCLIAYLVLLILVH